MKILNKLYKYFFTQIQNKLYLSLIVGAYVLLPSYVRGENLYAAPIAMVVLLLPNRAMVMLLTGLLIIDVYPQYPVINNVVVTYIFVTLGLLICGNTTKQFY